MTRHELETLAKKALRTDEADLSGLDDATAARYLVAKVTGRSDVLQRTDGYIAAACFELARQHGVRVARLDDPARDPSTSVTHVAPDASLEELQTRSRKAREDATLASEGAWRSPTVKVATPDPVDAVGAAWRDALRRTDAAPPDDDGSQRLDADSIRERFIRDSEDLWRLPSVGVTSD